MAQELPPIQWLVHGILPRSCVFVLFSEEAMGKSLLAYDLAFSIAVGGLFLNQQAHIGEVLYFDEENSENEISRRINGLARGRAISDSPLIPTNFHLWRNVLDGKFSDWTQDLKAECSARKPALVVIDTWSSVLPGIANIENDNPLMKRMVNTVKRAAQSGTSETSVLILHHNSKNPLTADKPRGAGAIVQAADLSAMLALAPVTSPNAPADRVWIPKKIRGVGVKMPDLRLRLHGDEAIGFKFLASPFKSS